MTLAMTLAMTGAPDAAPGPAVDPGMGRMGGQWHEARARPPKTPSMQRCNASLAKVCRRSPKWRRGASQRRSPANPTAITGCP